MTVRNATKEIESAGTLFPSPNAAKNMEESKRYERPDDAVLRMRLTEDQYAVTQEGATEPPYFNAYWDEEREGLYVDIVTGEPLFLSTDKFLSGGWPAFYHPIRRDVVVEKPRGERGNGPVEVISRHGQTHLGHVYDDGPIEHGGLRYQINSASLRFIPKALLKEQGYGEYLHYFN